MLLGSAGCTTDGGSEAEGSTTTTTTTATEPTTGSMTETSTTDDSVTQSSTNSEGEWTETEDPPNSSGSFYAPCADFWSPSECDPWAQDCPEGEKCVAYQLEGSETPYGNNHCVPITGDSQAGEPCVLEGQMSGQDNCDADSFCFPVAPGSDAGVCAPFCAGTPDSPLCDEGTHCAILFEGSVTACLAECDPMLQDCEVEGEVCTWTGYGADFVCLQPDDGAGGIGESCDGPTSCGEGVCMFVTVFSECESNNCCAAWCDVEQPSCDNPMDECVPFFDPELVPDEFHGLGVCVLMGMP